MEICLGQISRPDNMERFPGCGDCNTCHAHPDNKNCSRFWGITLSTLSNDPITKEEILTYENS